ncbi:MAG TPA: methyltransferase domain-containing protein [Vicinamibacterales bacterium]|nr:methyltransferase domain-containing protein [Vicinamibacterales bacterium]
MTEWNAAAYHKVSGPQTSWGQKVLARLQVRGDERAIDAGCGSGRLTAALMERLPAGRLLAIDRSWNMLMTARANLRPAFGPRVSFVQVDLPHLPVNEWADLVFSTATFHWVKDHPSLFAGIYAALRSGGRLHAQCGGGPNLAGAHALAARLMHAEPFAPYFVEWPGPWEFAAADVTATRLRGAGFVDIDASLEEAPTTLATEADYREFVTTVIYHPHLDRLPNPSLKAAFIDGVTELSSQDDPPFTLDYWRLNMNAIKP